MQIVDHYPILFRLVRGLPDQLPDFQLEQDEALGEENGGRSLPALVLRRRLASSLQRSDPIAVLA